MELITTTNSISGKIESIIRDAEKELYLVSPYIQLEKSEDEQWNSIKKAIRYAVNHKVEIYIIARRPEGKYAKNPIEIFKDFHGPYLHIYLVEDLHTKLYFNGIDALVSSMNLYFHSSKNNHEIGIQFKLPEDKDQIIKIRKYISYLTEDAEKYQTENELEQEEQKKTQYESRLKENDQGDPDLIQVEVLSIGYKWIKVKTVDGYENKIAIAEAPKMKEEKHYTLKAKHRWVKSRYGYTVYLEKVHDIEEIQGFCIACRKPTESKYDLCFDCNKKFRDSPSKVDFKFCHRCGKEKTSINRDRPLCNLCFKELKALEDEIHKFQKSKDGKNDAQKGRDRTTSSKRTSKRINVKEALKKDQTMAMLGFCIQCGIKIARDNTLQKVRCRDCWGKDKSGHQTGNWCHSCGETHQTSIEKPVCYSCYKNLD